MPWYLGYEPDADYDYLDYSHQEYDGHIYDAESGEEIAQVLNEATALRIVELYNVAEERERAAAPASNGKEQPKPSLVTELNYHLCHTCGRDLTRGQFAYSCHQFGRPLCPAHQPKPAAAAA